MDRDWLLIAPWYRWPKLGDRVGNEQKFSAPVLQKFDLPGCVDSFLDDPQHSLRFDDEDFVSATSPSGRLQIFLKRLRYFGGLITWPINVAQVRTDVRKIFLDTHKRYYLVVCELHCDAPGLPRESFDKVCEAGFVVRRYRSFNSSATGDVERLVVELRAAEDGIDELEARLPLHGRKKELRARKIAALKAAGTYESTLAAFKATRDTKAAELHEKITGTGDSALLQGWVPSSFDGVGAWKAVDGEPQEIAEATYPLYPLKPDPDAKDHDGQGVSIYFGLLPTAALETEVRGAPRYASGVTYHFRCFVKRHDANCPRGEKKPDCPGRRYWSPESDPYQLANFHDLDGSSNRPVNVEIPSTADILAKLKTATRPGEFSPVLLSSKVAGGLTLGQICFLSIPLVTIVGLVAFHIVLAILMIFIPPLSFLLLLQFCILPNLSINLELDLGGGVTLEAALQPMLELELDANVNMASFPNGIAVRNALLAAYPWNNKPDPADPSSFLDVRKMLKSPDPTPSDKELLAHARQAVAAKGLNPNNLGSNVGPLFSDKLNWETRVARSEVFDARA